MFICLSTDIDDRGRGGGGDRGGGGPTGEVLLTPEDLGRIPVGGRFRLGTSFTLKATMQSEVINLCHSTLRVLGHHHILVECGISFTEDITTTSGPQTLINLLSLFWMI